MSKNNNSFSLNYLNVNDFRGKSYDINFNDACNGPAMLFLGDNGSGKSSILEALLVIFGMFDAPIIFNNNPFDFKINYTINSNNVVIIGKKESDLFKLYINENNIKQKDEKYEEIKYQYLKTRLKEDHLLPVILSFYSGENDRMEKIYKQASRNYKKQLSTKIKNYEEWYSYDKHCLHFSNDLLPGYLFAAFNCKETNDFLKKYCNISNIAEMKYEIKITEKAFHTMFESETSAAFLNQIKERSGFGTYYNGPCEEDKKHHSIVIDFGNTWKTNKSRENDKKAIDLIRLLEIISSKLAGGFLTIKYKEDRSDSNEDIEVAEDLEARFLSQGQRQIIKILGIMACSIEVPSLVLIDEPDAFINPKWKYHLMEMISAIKGDDNPANVIIVSHEPLLVNGINANNVRLFDNSNNKLKIEIPDDETIGQGIDGLLCSQYFGLKTSYDYKTVKDYERRHELFVKLIESELSPDEEDELCSLSNMMGDYLISYSSEDFLFTDFLREYKKSEYYTKDYLTKEEVVQKRNTIKNIIDSLFEEK